VKGGSPASSIESVLASSQNRIGRIPVPPGKGCYGDRVRHDDHDDLVWRGGPTAGAVERESGEVVVVRESNEIGRGTVAEPSWAASV
jgi:hypothetical protein